MTCAGNVRFTRSYFLKFNTGGAIADYIGRRVQRNVYGTRAGRRSPRPASTAALINMSPVVLLFIIFDLRRAPPTALLKMLLRGKTSRITEITDSKLNCCRHVCFYEARAAHKGVRDNFNR